MRTIRTENISIKTSDPSIARKITTNIVDPNGTIYWYIRFNTPLDPESVSKYTMNVTDKANGYILNTLITYDKQKNTIVLNPTDLYRQNEYYLLNISTKVKSAKGNHLRKSVHIIFKLLADRISDFEILKNTDDIPKPRKKPAKIRRREREELMTSKIYADSSEIDKNIGTAQLPYGKLRLNPALAILGVLLLGVSIFTNSFQFSLAALAVCVLGISRIAMQIVRREVRSSLKYTLGVIFFNFGKYNAAAKRFNAALKIDPENELAEYAAGKVQYYLNKGK